MNLILKIIAIATLAVGASAIPSSNSLTDESPPDVGPSGTCCSNYCGKDNECYRWCVKAGDGGPCPGGTEQVAE